MKTYFLIIQSALILGLGLSNTYAQKFDQAYLKWKDEQIAQDQRLSQQNQNHYLSKPQLSHSQVSSTGASADSAKVRINSASVADLQRIKGVGEKKAQAILEYRQKNGPFKTVEDLQNVKGIGSKFIEKNKNMLTL